MSESEAQCLYCKKPMKRTGKRLPKGWKHRGDEFVCGDCWKQRYMLRAIAMSVASPMDCSWEDLRNALKPMWQATTGASNRIMTECYTRDVRRNGEEKMPPMPRLYLYPQLRSEFPVLPSQSVASLEQACQRKYRAKRYEVIWTAASSLPVFRYPTPFPMHNQSWHARIEQDRPVVSMLIGEKRMDLRLKSGPQFRRQYQQFSLVAKGEAVKGEAAIYQKNKALMVKMAAWLPRPEIVRGGEGTLQVRTAKDSLLVAVNDKNEVLWPYNGDHLRRWQAEHKRQLQRWSEDTKYENRPTPSFAERRSAAVRKHHDRMDSALHEIAAQLAAYASRRRFATVRYDDSEHGYCEQFPYFQLRTLLAQKLDEKGIAFEMSELSAETPELLAKE